MKVVRIEGYTVEEYDFDTDVEHVVLRTEPDTEENQDDNTTDNVCKLLQFADIRAR
jgi:hypothetical protein